MSGPNPDISVLLHQISAGDSSGYERLFPLILSELRSLAAVQLREERPDHTLQPTALVNEAYMRMVDLDSMTWRGRAHFMAAAAGIMRRILIDHARTKGRRKRGGGWQKIAMEDAEPHEDAEGVDLEALDEALQELAEMHPRQGRVVEMRYFSGMSNPDIAEVLNVSLRTIEGDWSMARRWLKKRLSHRE